MRKQQLSECIEKHPSKRALPEEEVIDSLAPALYWVRRGKPWHGLAWLGWASRVTVVLVGLGKGRQGKGAVLVTVHCCCCCDVSVSFSSIFCRNSEHAFQRTLPSEHAFQRTLPFCLGKKKYPFPKYGKILSSHRPPTPGPPHPPGPVPSPKNIQEPTVSGFCWLDAQTTTFS
jgi:hypothetical protein